MQSARRRLSERRGRLRGAALALATLATAGGLLAGAGGAAADAPPPPDVAARSYALVDATDGELLAGRAANRRSSIASTTKLMTAYVARRALGLSETVVAPAYQALAAESLLGLQAGEEIRVRDLLYGLLLASGNDAAAALADAAAGSQEAFVARMNRAAERLGLERTGYANPIGLDEPGNHSTALELIELTLELREDPFFRRVFDTPLYETRSGAEARQVVNRNTLVRTVPWVDGVKTGYTLDAGFVLIGSGERHGVELVSAVLGAPSEAARDDATLALLEHGLSLYQPRRPVERGELLTSVSVRDQGYALELEAVRQVRVIVRDDQRVETVVDAPAEVEGPLARGQRLGEASISVDGRRVARVPLVAVASVPEASLLERFDARVPGPRALAWTLAIGAPATLLALALLLRDRRRAARAPR